MSSTADHRMETLQVETDGETLSEIQKAADRYGLAPATYLLLLHALHEGRISAQMLSAIRELYTKDRDILEALAK